MCRAVVKNVVMSGELACCQCVSTSVECEFTSHVTIEWYVGDVSYAVCDVCVHGVVVW